MNAATPMWQNNHGTIKPQLLIAVCFGVVAQCGGCSRPSNQLMTSEDCRSALLDFVNESNDEMLLMSVDFLKTAVPKKNGNVLEFGAFWCDTQAKRFSIQVQPRSDDGCFHQWSGQFVQVDGKWKAELLNALIGNSNARTNEH